MMVMTRILGDDDDDGGGGGGGGTDLGHVHC
jgi:hypothetical protein